MKVLAIDIGGTAIKYAEMTDDLKIFVDEISAQI